MLNVEILYEALAASAADESKGATTLITKAEQLSRPQHAITPDTTSEELRTKFSELSGVATIAVTEDGKPIGMVNRNIFMEQYARPYARELYGRKTCIAFMDKTPLIVDSKTPIEVLVKSAVESGGKVLTDGFITTIDGQYQGVGTGFDLMKAMSEIEAEKTRQLMASINYASLIQRSHLVESDHVLQNDIGDYGLMWLPRDIVGGDAYFFRKVEDGVFGCVFDCTGHGVPGAFMTLIVMSFLEQCVQAAASGIMPGEILGKLNAYVKRVLRQDDRGSSEAASFEKTSNDGLDAAMFVLSNDQTSMRFASAKLSMLLSRKGAAEIVVVEGEKHPVGYADTMLSTVWPTQTVDLGLDCLVMIPTDGVIDQIGESRRIAHGKKRLIQFLSDNRHMSSLQLIPTFDSAFGEWQGNQKRRDDVTMLAFRTKSD
ncbi:MAG: SpoIIE family protein phosphatase [Rhodoferax sp.]|uniref:SpoIIE family protein phosphatase n=1 Tax=Rhodoferax sp. TaxID=50421 RepID=UPI0030178035